MASSRKLVLQQEKIFTVSVFKDVREKIIIHPFTISFSETCRTACMDLLEKLPYSTPSDLQILANFDNDRPCKNTTIALPVKLYMIIDQMKTDGTVRSVSAFVRFALELYLLRLKRFEEQVGVPMTHAD